MNFSRLQKFTVIIIVQNCKLDFRKIQLIFLFGCIPQKKCNTYCKLMYCPTPKRSPTRPRTRSYYPAKSEKPAGYHACPEPTCTAEFGSSSINKVGCIKFCLHSFPKICLLASVFMFMKKAEYIQIRSPSSIPGAPSVDQRINYLCQMGEDSEAEKNAYWVVNTFIFPFNRYLLSIHLISCELRILVVSALRRQYEVSPRKHTKNGGLSALLSLQVAWSITSTIKSVWPVYRCDVSSRSTSPERIIIFSRQYFQAWWVLSYSNFIRISHQIAARSWDLNLPIYDYRVAMKQAAARQTSWKSRIVLTLQQGAHSSLRLRTQPSGACKALQSSFYSSIVYHSRQFFFCLGHRCYFTIFIDSQWFSTKKEEKLKHLNVILESLIIQSEFLMIRYRNVLLDFD